VPLLDGKYEIHAERSLAPGVTEFTATDPDGVAVRVEWFELPVREEVTFERYRRLLKNLVRQERAALRDIVSRPGARYVAWYLPPEGSAAGRDPTIAADIEAAGFDPDMASLRRLGSTATLFALPFWQRSESVQPPEPGSSAASVGLGWWTETTRTYLLGGVLSLLAFASLAAGFSARHNDRVIGVRDTLGQSYAVAATALHQDGFRVAVKTVASDDHPAGVVIASSPAVGERLRPGREVLLSVALPSGQLTPTEVPRVVGSVSLDAAAESLQRAGLRLGLVQRVHLDTPAGVVVAQTPPAQTTVGQGASVDLVLSLGPRSPRTFLPDLVGLPREEAEAIALLAGLAPAQLVIDRIAAGGAPHDTVLAQSIAPYRDLPLTGATLRLVVAEAPLLPPAASFGLPALGGMSEAEAREVAADFEIRVQLVSDGQLPDGVIAQSLPLGAEPSDGPLVLTINRRPLRVPLPDVQVLVRNKEPRSLAYLWFIEPGILPAIAEVTATTLEGELTLVWRGLAQGGGRVSGTWETDYPGVVRFELTLNGIAYGGPLRVQ